MYTCIYPFDPISGIPCPKINEFEYFFITALLLNVALFSKRSYMTSCLYDRTEMCSEKLRDVEVLSDELKMVSFVKQNLSRRIIILNVFTLKLPFKRKNGSVFSELTNFIAKQSLKVRILYE